MNRNAAIVGKSARSTSDERQPETIIGNPYALAMELIEELNTLRNQATCAMFNLEAIVFRLGEQCDTNGDADAQIFHALSTLILDIERPLQEADQAYITGVGKIKAAGAPA